ncbi:lipopolysaccharide biosynthesis protein [Cocleimonas sp. KMM 6892]|uniref:lipopolysaccharide biosynthesis protein n=1 Tax=unclassified Cocleimonas TaxID=2639732 RepID=UPI002DBE38FE|nr:MULTISPECIES: lipopolysaccharide biosynthesis protein [unclassified Cocleimonas]MEB8430936.1 lipopolysaccharide biosynthesis protein [Cocleimonas sp. KMM 6892]MEC4714292.1 lipopolysaccharide biosynthesis protein [Cocleimonas sp. KMM 6895]MEC4743623.1 lipopolysaccharide biosynthesis protein [Cocleimonas sp. KMM 6896]
MLRPKSEYSKNILTLMTGTTIAQAIPIALSPIFTRIYSPEDFGLLAFYIAISSIISTVVSGRYELSIILPQKNEDAFQITCLCLAITIASTIFVSISLIVFKPQIVILLNNQEINKWLYLIPLSILLIGIHRTLSFWYNRVKMYKLIAKNRILLSAGTGFSQLGLGSLSHQGGLIWGTLFGQLLPLIQLGYNFISNDLKLYSLNYLKIIALSKRYSKFPKFDVPTALANITASQAPNILLAALFSPSAAGFFYLTQRVLQAPITLISSSVLDVFKQRASEDYKKHGNAKDIFKKTFLALFFMALPTSIILFFWVEDIFVLIFGEDWSEAGEYARILIPALFLRFITNPLSFMIYIAEKQGINLVGMLLLLTGMLVIFFIVNDAHTAITAISVLYCIVYGMYLTLSAKIAFNA